MAVFEKGHTKVGGRQKGTKNRRRLIDLDELKRLNLNPLPTHQPIGRDVQIVLDEMFRRVDILARLEQLVHSEDSRVAAMVIVKLLEYRFGKPQERLEVTGQLDVRGVIAQARARALAQRTAGSLTDGSIIDAEVVPENPPEIETQ